MWLLGVGGGVMTGMLKRLVLDGLQFHFISGGASEAGDRAIEFERR